MEQKFKKTDGGIDLQALRAFCIRRIQDGAKTESGLGGGNVLLGRTLRGGS